jgi:hypothetical protein
MADRQAIGIYRLQPRIISSQGRRRNNSPGHETIFSFSRRIPETRDGYQATNNSGGQRRTGKSGEKSMRTVSFILAFVFVIAGSSMAGSAESALPGVGTFSYNGTPVVPSQTLIVAVR